LVSTTARSPILAKMVENNGFTQQQLLLVEETIVLQDVGGKAFEFLLKFIYTGSLGSVVGMDCIDVTEILDACGKVKVWFIIELTYISLTWNCVLWLRRISVRVPSAEGALEQDYGGSLFVQKCDASSRCGRLAQPE
jgi:hypothetical protein